MNLNLSDITFVIVTYKSESVIQDCLNTLPSDSKKIIIENSKNINFEKDLKLKYDNIQINNIRITIDYQEDILMARKLTKILKNKKLIGNAQEIIELYKEYPELFSINKDKQIEFKNNQNSIMDSYGLKKNV